MATLHGRDVQDMPHDLPMPSATCPNDWRTDWRRTEYLTWWPIPIPIPSPLLILIIIIFVIVPSLAMCQCFKVVGNNEWMIDYTRQAFAILLLTDTYTPIHPLHPGPSLCLSPAQSSWCWCCLNRNRYRSSDAARIYATTTTTTTTPSPDAGAVTVSTCNTPLFIHMLHNMSNFIVSYWPIASWLACPEIIV